MDIEVPKYCDMRGLLSFYILWLIGKRAMCGEELAEELERARGERPNPGTIYPALKSLKENGLIEGERGEGRRIVYSLTPKGERELEVALEYFKAVYGMIIEDRYEYEKSDDLGIDYI